MTLLFPGVVAGVLPWRISEGRHAVPVELGLAAWAGWPVLLGGAAILLLTIWDFLQLGRGTLAPWDAPTVLVVRRLYRWTRNPMYVGVLGCILGQALLRQSAGVFIYFGCIALAFHIRVHFEERALLRQFGSSYAAYLQAVPRWIPRRPT
jgi:protein-S-isoprenylcysteine O-methyltransferase Ste14